MAWNWQQPDWPRFSWDIALLVKAEEQFLKESGVYAGVVRHLTEDDRERHSVEAISAEAVTTSEIEGEILDRASVQSSIRKQFGLAVDRRRVRPAEQGIAEMMVDLYRRFATPLSGETLFEWHRMLVRGRSDLKDIGHYRRGTEPMQVVSGPSYKQKVHFEAPPASSVPREMKSFIHWFNHTAPGGPDPLPGLTRAGIAHHYFISIHPFEDGNGRIARAIAVKSLAQAAGEPALIALAATILSRRKAYYVAIEASNKGNEITAWLRWFADIAIEAQQRTIAGVEFLIAKTRLLDRLRGQINQRQEKALLHMLREGLEGFKYLLDFLRALPEALHMLREGLEGFKGGLSAGNYSTITGASPATTTRDLADLVEKGALVRHGERRHTRYHLAISPRR